jgi:hypothetical protein
MKRDCNVKNYGFWIQLNVFFFTQTIYSKQFKIQFLTKKIRSEIYFLRVDHFYSSPHFLLDDLEMM